ncbi:Serine protease SPPA, chloroplastic [Linum perenne]
MANLLLLYASPQLTAVSPRTFTPLLLSPKPPHSLSLPHSAAHCQLIPNPLFHSKLHRRSLSVRAFDSSDETRNEDDKNTESDDKEEKPESEQPKTATAKKSDVDYPHGEFEFKKKFGFWTTFFMKLRMLIAFPWERVRKGSVLAMKLRGEISDLPKSRFSSALSLPQICENFIKAAYDPRIPGIYLEIDSLACGWGKVEEIRRHILDFKKSGKFIVAYIPTCREKEYYLACACSEIYAPPSAYFSLYGLTVEASFLGGVLEKVGIQPELQRIGKYKSAGDQLLRKSMSDANCEMLTALLDDIYGNWLDKVSSDRGIKREDLENFISEGVYQVDRLKDDGLITDILYDDEVLR